MKKIQLLFAISILFIACNTNNNTSEPTKVETAKSESGCIYTVNSKDVKFEWTAFKTTEKIAVKGSFNTIEIQNSNKSKSISELLTDTEFFIDVKSINSGDETRDAKLVKFFFSNLEHEGNIKGYTISAKGEDKGIIVFNLYINKKENEIAINYKREGDIINIYGQIDLLDWKAGNAIESLNEVCKEKHTGKDGKTKTWSVVDINLFVPISKECD